MAESLVSHCILMSSFSERAPEMPEEKREFLKSSATNRSYETGPVKVKFGRAAASLFDHSSLAPCGEISIHGKGPPVMAGLCGLETGCNLRGYTSMGSSLSSGWIKILVRVRFGGFQWS